MEQYFSLICKTPLFSGIPQEDLKAMFSCLNARIRSFSKGEAVFLEGDASGTVYLVLEGSVQILREDYFGNRSIMTQAEPGDIFAEAFVCAGIDTMPVSSFAVRDSKVLTLAYQKMLTVCTNACSFHNQLIRNLLQVVSRHNLKLGQKIQHMSQKTTRDKLMAYLSDQAKLSGSSTFRIPFDRQALADYLGVERSAMSAELSKLRKAGILETEGSAFRLLQKSTHHME